MSGVTSALVAELESATNGGSPERRVQILLNLADLFLSEATRLTEQQVGVFDDVLLRLMDRIEVPALAQLSVRLSGCRVAPINVTRRLAQHEDGSVAMPVLSKPDRLSDSDLIDIADSRSQQHLQTIAGRKMLNKAVTDALLKRGDSGVFHVLANNAGARFSDVGYAAFIDRSGRDDDLAEEFGLRSDIPVKVLRELLSAVSEAVRSRLLKAARPEMRERIQSSIHQIGEKIGARPIEAIDYTEAKNAVLALNRAGKLKDQTINRLAVQGEYAPIVAALSLLSTVNIETVESLIFGEDSNGLIVACRAARLDWSTAVSIIQNRPNCFPVSEHKLEEGREIFEALALSTAQHTIRIWSSRAPAKKPEATNAFGRKVAARV